MIRNRRNSERMPAGSTRCSINIDSSVSDGVLIDTSSSGFKIGRLNLLMLFVDQKVELQTEHGTFLGRCRTVSRDSDGTFQVGILRVADDFVENLSSILINSFVNIGDRRLVCVPTAFEQNSVEVQLLNGERRSVASDQFTQMTRQERLEELCDADRLTQALSVHDRKATGNDFSDRTLVLNHEFGLPTTPCVVGSV